MSEPGQVSDSTGEETPQQALASLVALSRAIADGSSLGDALDAIVQAAAGAAGASVVIARLLEPPADRVRVWALACESPAVGALLEGTKYDAAELPSEEEDESGPLPEQVRLAARHAGANAILVEPIVAGGRVVGGLELMRAGTQFGADERFVARVAAAQAAAAVRAFGPEAGRNGAAAETALELAGEALAAGRDESSTAEEIARVAFQATAALACALWRRSEDRLELLASEGAFGATVATLAHALALDAFDSSQSFQVARPEGGARGSYGGVVTIPLGQPARFALQLFFDSDADPSERVLATLATFAVRAAHALRASERSRAVEVELERTRALLALVAQASEQLSLAHTLQTAIERVAGLLGVARVGIYLRQDGHLLGAAGRSLAGPHVPVAERLLGLALGPFRGRGIVVLEDTSADRRLAGLGRELVDAQIEAAVAVPLLVPDEVIGLLAVYPSRGRVLQPNEAALLAAIAAQLAVAVQNARLHEQATELGAELEEVLALERQAARQLKALYEISRSFAQSLSLERTLEAVVRTVVELLEVDAASIRMPDARGELLVPRALHVADARLGPAVRAVLSRPIRLDALPNRQQLMRGQPLVLDPALAAQLGQPDELLVPFLEKGSTAVVLPIATPTELLGTLKLLSLDPARPITAETIEIGLSVAAQAALAIDNARLYQHQKEFADTMQHSLLPRSRPRLRGLELGEAYESSARVDVGGDLYDFLLLEDGRLAVVLGDVTGHGIDAAADMAMAKFVFRSLARIHPEPADFLAAANEVVCGDIAAGKFITMLYLVIDPASGEFACASAGHPQPRLVLPDESVRALEVRGLALGIDPGQTYEQVAQVLPVGGSVVLYTDGVIESRRDGELFGAERLDRLLAERRGLPPRELALAALAECRAFGGGELSDDCALVVLERTGQQA